MEAAALSFGIANQRFKMNETIGLYPTAALSDSEFALQVRQALLSAKHTIPKVAVLLFALDNDSNASVQASESSTGIHNSMCMRLRNALRDADTVAVLSSGQVGVLLQSVSGPQDLERVINRLLLRIAEPIQIAEQPVVITPRIGAALAPEHGESVHELLDHAQRDLEKSKTTIQPYAITASPPEALVSSRQWMGELRQAIVTDQLFLTYQPKVSLQHQEVTGVEVLVRWQHPEYGIIVPDHFIPFAERTGLIIPMTLWVLQQALLQCRAWNDLGLDISIAVNLSMWNLEAQELPGQIAALLCDTGVSPENLELEITESSIMTDPQRVIRTLSQIRSLGVRFAIDDFGTGYSSFAYLTKLPVSCIKIDKSFVLNIDSDRDSSVIVRSIIDLGHNLGLKVVAEGVESARAKAILQGFQCDEAQGYHFCRPVVAEAMTEFLSAPPAAVTEQVSKENESWQPLDPAH